jgi:hypothetical protein
MANQFGERHGENAEVAFYYQTSKKWLQKQQEIT